MKFTTLVTLIAASSAVFAIPFEKRGFSATDLACAAAIKSEVGGCISSDKITLSNLDSVCSTYKSDKCQDFFNSNSLGTNLACGSTVKSTLETIKKAIKLHAASVIDLKCAKDENGNVCPISNYVIENGNIPSDSSDQKWQDAVNETGKSKNCSESFNNFANNYINNADDAAAVNEAIGGNLTPETNTDVLNDATKTINNAQGGNTGANGANDTTGANGTNGTNGANGANSPNGTNGTGNVGSGQGTPNQGNTTNDKTSDATSVKASLALAIVFALSTLL